MTTPTGSQNQDRRELHIGATTIPYRVRTSRRAREKRIEVTPTEVVVIAPEDTPTEGRGSVEEFLASRQRWLFNTVTDLRRREAGKASIPQTWQSGAKLMYRGRNLMLIIQEADVEKVSIRCRSRFHVEVPRGLSESRRRAALRHAFGGWLRGRALRDAREFCEKYAARLGESYEAVELSDQQDMWGTCEKDGVLRINWRLIQAPKFAMEYVCAHEVCHLVHRHHDEAFWDVLGEVMVEWREAKERLEEWEVSTFEWGRDL